MNRLSGAIVVVVCLAILNGCAATKRAKKVEGAGFLRPEIYSMMEDGDKKELEPARRYLAENVDWRTYNKIKLDPIVTFVGTKGEDEGVSQEDTQKILDYFFNKIYRSIEESSNFQIASQPGPGTIRMQFAVVDLGKSNVTMGAISTYLPQAALISSVTTMGSDKPAFVGELGVEYKITDSSTGKLMAAGIDKRYGGKKWGKGTNSWADVYNIMDYYVKLLGFRLCRIQERDNCERP